MSGEPTNRNPEKLSPEDLVKAVDLLCDIEKSFRPIVDTFGYPPMWDRSEGFPTLVHIILEQQVSLASALAAFTKLKGFLGEITPQSFLSLDDITLKTIGFSRQKALYCRLLAQTIIDGRLPLEKFTFQPDDHVRKALMGLKGIGTWTTDIYLLMVLLRPDVWPHGDRALAVAAFEVFKLKEIPDYDSLANRAKKWRPWRSVAARLLWHHYLSTPRSR